MVNLIYGICFVDDHQLTTGVTGVKSIVAKEFSKSGNVDVDATIGKSQHQQALMIK